MSRWYGNDLSLQFLQKDYLLPGQSVDDRIEEMGRRAETILGIPGFASKFIDYKSQGFFSLSTPIWMNFGNDRGLPISCYGSSIEDTTESILFAQSEVSMMTKHGGGTSVYLGKLRSRGSDIKKGRNGKSSGACHFAQLFENDIKIWSQGSARRGNCAVYYPVDHPDIMEFLTFRSEGSPIQDLSFGVCIPSLWMEQMIKGDHEKRVIWAKILETRGKLGLPYLFFTDNANSGAPEVYRENNLWIDHSNLCTEISLPNNNKWSFVCCLLSLNDYFFDQWKDTDVVWVVTAFLDAVMNEFIQKASLIPYLERAVRFAAEHRALGIGRLGYHSYLQKNMIPFESMEAKWKNVEIQKHIYERAYEASSRLFSLYGSSDLMRKYKRRNSTLLAGAPTKSSSFIENQVSEFREPIRGNYFIKDLAKLKASIKNPVLLDLLQKKGKDTLAVWDSILKNAGSVQHLDCLSEKEKLVFRTFREISPMEIITQAAQAQKWIDQGQSINQLIDPRTPIKEVNSLMIHAWESGLKSLYYQYSFNAAQELSRSILSCSSCES